MVGGRVVTCRARPEQHSLPGEQHHDCCDGVRNPAHVSLMLVLFIIVAATQEDGKKRR